MSIARIKTPTVTPWPGVSFGGARSSAFFKDVLVPARSVGAMLRPEAASALLGCPADSLAERHLPLSAFWGDLAHRLCERLMGIGDAEEALALFEAALLARLPRVRGLHPAMAAALDRFSGGEPVAGRPCRQRLHPARFHCPVPA